MNADGGITAGQGPGQERGGGAAQPDRGAGRGAGVRRVLVTVAPFPVAAAVVATAYVTLADRLPDTLATHFRADGHADGFTDAAGFLTVPLVTFLVLGALFGLSVLAPRGGRRSASVRRSGRSARPYAVRPAPAGGLGRGFIALGYGVAGFLGYNFTATLHANVAAGGDRTAVVLSVWQLAVGFGTGVLAAGLGWLLAGKDAPLPEDGVHGGAPRLDLAGTEVAGWSRTTTSTALYVVGFAVLVAAPVVGLLAGWSATPGLLFGGLLVVALGGLRVTADRRGVTITPPLVPYPRMRIPLERIREADSRHVAALREFGGWGYRMRAGAGGLVVRSGEALSLRLAGGKEFVVTVDDATTAAALLNALVDRAASEGDAGRPGGAD